MSVIRPFQRSLGRKAAFVSYHTSPLAVPGQGDAGGLNVYVHDLTTHLARAGIASDIYTRRADADTPDVVELAPGVRVRQVEAGPPAPVDKAELAEYLGEFTKRLADEVVTGGHDLVHSHYWMSGLAALDAAATAGVPVVHTNHTLARLRALPDGGSVRLAAEARLCAEADLLVANTPFEADALIEAYGAAAGQVQVIPPGVDHAVFAPGDRAAARARLGLDDADLVVIFIGRIQRLKGADLAVATLAELSRRDPSLAARVTLIVAGGASGPDGAATLAEMQRLAADPQMRATVRFVPPRPHTEIASLYQAADVCLVPSRSESFGLVALEAQACGVPVVATAIEGLQHVVTAGIGGLLAEEAEPVGLCDALRRMLADDHLRATSAASAQLAAAGYSWAATAQRHVRAYARLCTPADASVGICGSGCR